MRIFCIWRSLLALLCSSTATSTLRGTSAIVVVVVVVVVTSEDALSQLLLSAMDIGVKLVAILPNRELLVIVDRNIDTASADGLILRIVELCNIWMT